MKMRTWIASLCLAGAAISTPALAQMPGMGPPAYGQPGYGYGQPGYGPMPGAGPGMANPYQQAVYPSAPLGYHPNSQIAYEAAAAADPQAMPLGAPAGYGYGDGMYTGEGTGDFAPQGGEGCADGSCGPGGCGPFGRLFGGCGTHCHPRLAKWLRCLLPFDDGGCCAPHWFDVHAEYMHLRREDVSRRVDFYSDTVLGPIVLSTDNLEFQPADGFRVTLTKQLGPGSNLELGYFGQNNFTSSAAVTSPNNQLFSAFSGFGVFPNAGLGFTETDQASFASIAYSSQINNLELNYRQRWQCYGCKVQGSWLTGARFFQLDEDFQLNSISTLNSAQAQYNVGTYNGLFGGQGGGDIWICVIPGLSIGMEGKAGLYMNHSQQSTIITGTTLLTPFEEKVTDTNDVAFIGETAFMATWRLSQSWTLRGGYNIIYIDGVALAPENFNPTPPFLVPAFTNPPRQAALVNDGNVLLHGCTIGFEYMW
jgi:hypothetical protein